MAEEKENIYKAGNGARGRGQILYKDSGRQIRERTQRRMLEKYNVPVGVSLISHSCT